MPGLARCQPCWDEITWGGGTATLGDVRRSLAGPSDMERVPRPTLRLVQPRPASTLAWWEAVACVGLAFAAGVCVGLLVGGPK